MSHALHYAVSLELARHVAARLRGSTGPLESARDNLARWSRQNSGSVALLRCYAEWKAILDRSVDEICDALCAESEEGRRLRQNSPFAGVLPPGAVWDIKRRHRFQHAALPA